MKPTVYIETSVVSYLTSRPSRDLIAAARQERTVSWWEHHEKFYTVYISDLVNDEAAEGDSDAAVRRMSAMAGLPVLAVTDAAVSLADRVLDSGLVPQQAAADALHVAVAALNNMDYLLTWNCKHLANAAIRRSLEEVVTEAGFYCPVICTPEELSESQS